MTRHATALLVILFGPAVPVAIAQVVPPRAADVPAVDSTAGWHLALSVANLFEGNVNHDVSPLRSYGLVPAADVTFATPKSGLTFAYEIAENRYTATNEWDRVSHALETAVRRTVGKRLRLEAAAEASWKGTSEDRELANVFGVTPRAVFLLSKRTRLSFSGSYRYKQYVEEPASTGPSPSAGVKFDRRLGGSRRLTVGYKYQTRIARTVRNRYRRSAYTAEFTTPLAGPGNKLSIEVEYRSQQYERLIKVGQGRALRLDRRLAADVHFDHVISAQSFIRWTYAFEARRSNDPSKHFFAPVAAMTLHYQLR
jgi:hypothetical protein